MPTYVYCASISPIQLLKAQALTKTLKASIFLLCLLVFASSCSTSEQNTESHLAMPDSIEKPLHAKGFWFEKYQGYEILCLKPFLDSEDTLRYALYPRGNKPAELPKNATPLATPIQSMVALSATHIGIVEALGELNKLVGITYPDYIYNEEVRQGVEQGKIADVGMEGGLNKELLLAKMPDLIMATGMSATAYQQDYQVITGAGICVWPNAEWLEGSVLGRAEWLVAVGALFGKKEEAVKQFSHIDSSYQALKALTKPIVGKPTVLGGLPYKGAWSIAGGNSYVVKLLQDAGGAWPWADDTSATSLQLDFEAVYPVALNADCWLRVGTMTNLEDLISMDSRFADFNSVKNGQVYNYIHRLAPNGMGNDYWESGVVKPHIILADLVKILHPDLLPEHELYYYQRL